MAHIRLFKHYVPTVLILLAAIEAALLFVSLLAGYAIRFAFFDGIALDASFLDRPLLIGALVYTVVMLLCTTAMGVYSAGLRGGNAPMAVRTVVAYCLLGTAVLTLLYYLIPALYMGRGVLFYSVVAALVLVVPVRWAFLRLVDAESLRDRVLVLGVGEQANKLATYLASGHAGVARIVAFIQTTSDEKVAVKGEIAQRDVSLAELVNLYEANEIVVALDDRRSGQGSAFPLDELFDCKMQGIRITDAITVCERELGVVPLSAISPGWLVFSTGFAGGQLVESAKRASDVFIALVLLLLTWPLMLIAAIAIVLESGRPVFYQQTRVGLGGKTFSIFKFRSMVVNAEKEGEAVWATAKDSRVTHVGAVLRNTRIDELPQLWNVLRGDMSFVGPRPERPEFVQGFAETLPFYNERHRVKPGLMGWAQLNYPYGASDEDAEQKLRYDLYYVKNKSLMLDLVIMVQTVQVILLGMGVH
ncbi:MAG: TIGR03013 family PEP-CTERM/XrtA system glycosyltransferase [Gammaproteobacteria bacterium]|nr:TIGR03013 family PEP-CTERM/XrtA system glycosyltransferase [Gammaproteobacteria bacterium]